MVDSPSDHLQTHNVSGPNSPRGRAGEQKESKTPKIANQNPESRRSRRSGIRDFAHEPWELHPRFQEIARVAPTGNRDCRSCGKSRVALAGHCEGGSCGKWRMRFPREIANAAPAGNRECGSCVKLRSANPETIHPIIPSNISERGPGTSPREDQGRVRPQSHRST